MRIVVPILAFACLAPAQERKVPTRTVQGAGGRLEITVPESWEDAPLGDGHLLHLHARHTGGHVLTAVRESGQADVDRQRDRYMEHDAANYAGGEFQKIADPFFGYRMNDPAKNRVLLRAFLADGSDGIVLTISSRYKGYDTSWAAFTIGALATARIVAGAGGGAKAERAEPAHRLFDKEGRFSLLAPGEWKTLTPEEDADRLLLGHKGSSSGPTLRVVEEGEQDNPLLVLFAIQGQWKRDYGGIAVERVGVDPPALLAKNRKPGWIDYVIAFAAGGRGFTLRLAVREGSFERFRSIADEMAASIVFMGDPYRAPEQLPGDVEREYKRSYVVHARAEEASAADAVVDALKDFDREWGRVAPSPARKGEPLHLVVARGGTFAEIANGFGHPPATYDRLGCTVVVAPPPADVGAAALWRGRLWAALAEAALHRDLAVAPPPWLLAGLTACMDAAGRSGGKPDTPHPALVPLLKAAETPVPLGDVFAYTYGDVLQGETPGPLAASWGYTHLMLYGRSTLKSLYRKWEKELRKAERAAPPFDAGNFDAAQEDLKRHIERELAK